MVAKKTSLNESHDVPSRKLIARCENAAVYNGSFYGIVLDDVDMVAVDPPWRQGNLSYWSHRAGTEQRWDVFKREMTKILAQVDHVYLKVGLKERDEWMSVVRDSLSMPFIATWETTYYAGKNAQILASRLSRVDNCHTPSTSPESANSVARWAALQSVESVCDPCVGLGKMAKKFRDTGAFVLGVELCADRAEKAAKRLCK